MDKLIITAAITGSVHVPTQTPHLPLTPKEIADESVRSAEAGAAVVHIHARDPEDGKPTSDLEVFRGIITSIKERSDGIICISTGGGAGMSIEERTKTIPTFKPEMASFNMGSMNFGLFPALGKFKEFKFPWEKPFLEMTRSFIFANTFADLEYICTIMRENGTKPEHEMYDVGHLYNTNFLLGGGLLDPPLHMQFVMGILGGIQATVEDLLHMKKTADRLYGEGKYTWSVIGAGYPAEFHMGTVATMMGGHVRVGMEDNVRIRRGEYAKSNAELVEKMVRIAGELGRDIATADEARTALGLKGKENVNF
ncbi:MAG: 3-keto-5-aminohexanoate cleavage protein [Proteobacteria bacterium]|nr:3-keto-5-aminohexanoate cleavage protein [Pseudomonadota bacterium]